MIFLDTSGLFCLQHRDEPQHAEALTLFGAAPSALTHGYVLAEYVALATTRGIPRRPALDFLDAMTAHPAVAVAWVDSRLHRDAMRLLAARLDKQYSLADAISFVLMQRAGVHEALTTDHHFEQAGFVRLLAP